jgi:uncharacterized protein (TIGR02246 family)
MIVALLFAVLLQEPDSAAVRELEAIEQQLASTWKAGDCDSWAALLAPEWSVIHLNADVITKAEALKMCKEARPTIADMQVDQLTVRLFGDAAVVTGRTSATTGDPNPTTIALRFTDVFVRRSGKWLVVASQATRLPS